ncbi:M1 family aminopeptidase [Planococcus lenghuensis]|uniref:Peptidase M1 membrane alanine aminopeptidase domain-containing protein n=1 Tax=Planococcus lenghuensis TaxID=2213202 RepID=A0A1Q2KWV0_9BACL|nr:M1 family aminopeptidase [Planococcus lenghuensis]AQQ52606.1 hypothetical protein B0X71_05510 [Planococcus lenghuensis]
MHGKKYMSLIMTALILSGCNAGQETEEAEPIEEESVVPDIAEVKESTEESVEEPAETEEPVPELTAVQLEDIEGSPAYGISMVMDEEGLFRMNVQVRVTNETEEAWQDLGFHFVPNAFTEENKPLFLEEPAIADIIGIKIEEEEVPYELDSGRLLLQLTEPLEPGAEQMVEAEYTLGLPENGVRLSKVDGSFFLAHWYPMLGRYDEGWKIEDFNLKGESYETGYGNYVINYELPREFLVASSAVDDETKPVSSGTVEGEQIKDFYIAFMDPENWVKETTTANDTELRIFMPAGSDYIDKVAISAENAFAFFEQKIGDNPAAQLDIIANNGAMEYPNIIEVRDAPDDFRSTLVHEIGHQWFYYLVSNDPFSDAFLDEGLTEWASAMYLEEMGDAKGFELSERLTESNSITEFANVRLDEFGEMDYYATVYGKVPLLLQEYFEANGGEEKAFEFLSAYYKEFKYEYVDAETFAVFFEEQLEGDQQEFLNSWLRLE